MNRYLKLLSIRSFLLIACFLFCFLNLTDVALANNFFNSGNFNSGNSIKKAFIEKIIAETPQQKAGFRGLLKQLTVTTTADDGTGSLRWAINQANESPEDDLIDLSQVSGTIKLKKSLPKINSNMTIVGNGDDLISGDEAHQVLYVNSGEVTIKDLTIADGRAMGNDGENGAGGAAGMGGGLFINGGTVTLSSVRFVNNHAFGGQGTARIPRQATKVQTQILADKNKFNVNRGGIVGVNGISLPNLDGIDLDKEGIRISGGNEKFKANRGAIAGMNGIGIGGIGSIAFGGGGGFGGFGNGGAGGNGGTGGKDGGNGGNGGDGGNGGTGVFASFDVWGEQGIGSAAFSGGAGFGGLGNAGNGGSGGVAKAPIADGGKGGKGGNGGHGGFGGGGGSGGFGGQAGNLEIKGIPGRGGFGGGDGQLGFGGGGGGFGGAIFVRAGNLILNKTAFENNTASGGIGENLGQGKGGAIFIVTEDLKQQAEINEAPKVSSFGRLPVFISNMATQAENTSTDNPDVFGTIQVR